MIGRWNDRHEWVPLEPTPADYVNSIEPHARGAGLVATIFDAFHRIYQYRTRDLFRIASNGTGVLPEGSISADLVRRLAREASEVAEHFLHICIRALDYCPPNDITFGSYLRALITADLDIAPEDENGYRLALIEAFRARGIFPRRVNTLSVESLCWNRPDFSDRQQQTLAKLAGRLKPLITAILETSDREELFDRSMKAQAELNRLLVRNEDLYAGQDKERFLSDLGLTSLPVGRMFGPDSRKVRFLHDDVPDNTYTPPIECHTIRPAFRSGREHRQIEQVVVTLTQRIVADIGEPGQPRRMVFRGGCSLIFSLGNLNSVDYVILKNIKSYERFCRQVAYLNGDEDGPAPSSSLYAGDGRSPRIRFDLLHGGDQ
jgi:hypothetical protein